MFEKLIAKIVGKKIIQKLNLYEGAAMPTKPWYQSKAVWSAVLMTIVGAVQPISTAFGHPVTVPTWITDCLMGLGIYGLRTATTAVS